MILLDKVHLAKMSHKVDSQIYFGIMKITVIKKVSNLTKIVHLNSLLFLNIFILMNLI